MKKVKSDLVWRGNGYGNGAIKKNHGSRSCTTNQNHRMSPPDESRICIVCKKLTAPLEADVIKGIFNGKKISICYNDLRDLNKISGSYFPSLPVKMPKNFNLEKYFQEIKKILSPKKNGDKKLTKTLLIIKKYFFKNSYREFIKVFFSGNR